MNHEKCQPGDIAIVGHRKLSRVVEIATLMPLEAVLGQAGDYFARVRDRFLQDDRVSFVRYNNDAYEPVIEILPLAIVNRLNNNGVQFIAKSEVVKLGEPEQGWKLVERDGLHTIRRNGRTIGRYRDRRLAEYAPKTGRP